MGLDNRIKTMNNDMIKLDVQISDCLDLRQDEDRILEQMVKQTQEKIKL